MPHASVYGCGYNGFSQIDDFGLLNSEGSISKSAADNSGYQGQPKRTKVHCPKELFQIKADHEMYGMCFTWARIAVTLKKGGDDYTSYVTGHIASNKDEKGNLSTVPAMLHSSIITASTDSDILFRGTANENPKTILCGLSSEFQPVNINFQDRSATVEMVGGGHKDFFTVYDSISFGRLSVQESHSTKNTGSECDENKLMVNLQLCPVDSGVPVSSVSCGKEHSLLLSKHGTVYTCGLGSRGQLGHGSVEAESSLRLLEALEGVKMVVISAGGWHSAAISEIGDLYMWGWNESGQLGISTTAAHQRGHQSVSDDEAVGIQALPYFIKLPDEFNITAVACGSRHTVFLTDSGRVFTTGCNAYGQLGLGHTDSQDKFTEVKKLQTTCIKIFAGQWNSFFVCCN